MRLHRLSTRWLSSWLIAVLLLTQLVTSAYACPGIVGAASIVSVMDMPGCDGNMPAAMDPDQPQLCQAHCQQGSQAAPHAPALDAPSVPLLVAVLDWAHDHLLPAQPTARAASVSPGASPPGSPPLYLSLLVLRN